MKVGKSSLKVGKRRREETGTATSFVSFDPKSKRFPRTLQQTTTYLGLLGQNEMACSSLAAREAGKTE